MKKITTVEFHLNEFPQPVLQTTFQCKLQMDNSRIVLVYKVSGDLDNICFPGFSGIGRENNLWEETCFEFFIGDRENPRYYEFNFSPSGKWNAYSFLSRREKMKEEAITNIKIKTERTEDNFILTASVDLPDDKNFSSPEVQLAAILKTEDKVRHFFAVENSVAKPDFHNREYFVLLH